MPKALEVNENPDGNNMPVSQPRKGPSGDKQPERKVKGKSLRVNLNTVEDKK